MVIMNKKYNKPKLLIYRPRNPKLSDSNIYGAHKPVDMHDHVFRVTTRQQPDRRICHDLEENMIDQTYKQSYMRIDFIIYEKSYIFQAPKIR